MPAEAFNSETPIAPLMLAQGNEPEAIEGRDLSRTPADASIAAVSVVPEPVMPMHEHAHKHRRRRHHHERRRKVKKILGKILFVVLHVVIIAALLLLWMHFAAKPED